MSYAIVRTGGKQYRVEPGQSLLVERLPADEGSKVTLEPMLYVDGSDMVDGPDLSRVKVEGRVAGHERGPKLRIVKFKPKRGYKRRTGHRQELTRVEITEVKVSAKRERSRTRTTRAPAEETKPEAERPKPEAERPKPEAERPKPEAERPKPEAERPAKQTAARRSSRAKAAGKEASDGS